MNPELIEYSLRPAGLTLCGLVAANFVATGRFRYHGNLAGCEVMVRQIFHVHCALHR